MSASTIDTLCHSVSADEMMTDLGEFARRIKLSGTEEELASFRSYCLCNSPGGESPRLTF